MKIPFRRTLVSLAVSGLVAATVILAGYVWLRQSLPQSTGEIMLEGLSAPVEILRDEQGLVTRTGFGRWTSGGAPPRAGFPR
jgi:penicillin amidase